MHPSKRCAARVCVSLFAVFATTAAVDAQIFGGSFAGKYTSTQLPAVPGLPGFYGGMLFERGDGMTLLIGGNADNSLGALYAVHVTRDAQGHVDGFTGTAVKRADTPFIDGGLAYGPGEVLLYTAFPINMLGQLAPGATAPTKTTLLSGLGVGGSVGGCAVVTSSLGGNPRIKFTSPGLSRWYDAPLLPDGFGTFDVGLATPHGPVVPSAGNMVYIGAGQPGFAVESVLVTSCNGAVGAYSFDLNGDIVANIGSFVISIAGCADGMCVDPLTGDLLLGITDLKRIFVVRGFTAISTFCEPMQQIGSCQPSVTWSGTPSLSGPDDFVISAERVPPNQNGIEIWSLHTTQHPFANGFLCLAAPVRRIQIPAPGGGGSGLAPDCGGSLTQPWSHTFMASQSLTAGTTVYTQFVVRDQAPSAVTNLLISDGLRFTITN